MNIIKKISVLQKLALGFKQKRKTIGFVPTMGFLHEGHLSLIRKARKENDIVIVSIFVNPVQFGPNEDFKIYPRNIKKDISLSRPLCDILFMPSREQMYPKEFSTFARVKGLSDHLCGCSRKNHFTGVATVVCKLFNIVLPDNVYFGQKDFQQAVIIARMIKDLNFALHLKVLPIVREKDGLAMSSRNVFLSRQERKDAVVLFQALKSAQRLVANNVKDSAKIIKMLQDFISHKESARVDYIKIVDKTTLESIKRVGKEALLALAVYVGNVRLIDNVVLKAKNEK